MLDRDDGQEVQGRYGENYPLVRDVWTYRNFGISYEGQLASGRGVRQKKYADLLMILQYLQQARWWTGVVPLRDIPYKHIPWGITIDQVRMQHIHAELGRIHRDHRQCAKPIPRILAVFYLNLPLFQVES